MIIHIAASNLLEGLNIVTRAITARPAKPIMEGVLIETNEDSVFLTCTDGTLTIRTKVEATIKQNGQTVLPGKLLTELVRKLPDGNIEISINEKNIAKVKCMQSRTNLACMSAIEFPVIQTVENGQEVLISQKQVKDMIQRVLFAIATDESRQILTGCLLEVTDNEARMVGLDGFRLALQKYQDSFTLPEGVTKLEAVIPGKVLSEMSKILKDDEESKVSFVFDKTRLFASFDDTSVSSVLLAGEYINYRQILPTDWRTRVKVSRSALADAIDRASLMAREGKNNLIKISLSETELTLMSNAELGDVQETIDMQIDGVPLEIAFNARYLTDVIRNITDNEVCMRFNSNVSPCVICPTEGEKYTYLVLPVRVF